MWKKSKVWENKKFRVLLLVEIIFLAAGILGLIPGSRVIEDESAMEITLNSGIWLEGREGYYIDGSYGYGGPFLTAETGRLRPGVYQLRIDLVAGDDGVSSFGIADEPGQFRRLLSNEVDIVEGSGEQTCRFYVCGIMEQARITINYGGGEPLLVRGIELVRTNAGSRVLICLTLAAAALVNTLVMLYCYLERYPVPLERKLVWFGVPAIALLASLPLMVDYMIVGEESLFHWTRIATLAGNIRRGIPSVWEGARCLYSHGCGDAVFCGDTFLVFPALLILIGFDMNAAYGVYVFAVNLATAMIAFLCFRGCWKERRIGMLGSMLYTLAPCRLELIYQKGALGEYTAMLFPPLLIYGFYLIFTEDIHKREYKRLWLLPALGLSGILQSHILSFGIMGGAFSVLLCLFLARRGLRGQTLWELAKAVLGTLGFSLWYLTPVLGRMASGGYRFSMDWRPLAVAGTTLLACAVGDALLKGERGFWRNAFFAVVCGTAIVAALYRTNDILMKSEGLLRLYSAEALSHTDPWRTASLAEGAAGAFPQKKALDTAALLVSLGFGMAVLCALLKKRKKTEV